MISKQIGQSRKYYLLYEALRSLDRINKLAPHIGWNTGQQPSTVETPLLINDDVTSTSTRLYWTDLNNVDSFVLQKDGVQIYAGTDTSFNATGLLVGATYSFRIKAIKAGYTDSAWTTISVTIPTFYNAVDMDERVASTATRQTALEPLIAARSWSGWIKIKNTGRPEYSATLMTSSESGGNRQYSLTVLSSESNTTPINALRFLLFGNSSGTIFLSAISSLTLKKNYWHHFTCTYDGSNTAAGINLWLDGVKDTSVTRSTTGAFTTPYSDSNLRTRIGSSIVNRKLQGIAKDFVIWNRVLTDVEVPQTYNNGIPVTVTGLSFYATAVAAYWPLSSNFNATNSATFNLTATAGTSFVSSAWGLNATALSMTRAYPTSTDYCAFGGSYQVGGDIYVNIRSGTGHVDAGVLKKLVINIAAKTISPAVTIVSNGASQAGGSGGIVGNKIVVFASKYPNGAAGDFTSANRHESTDGTVGTTFGSPISMTTNYTRYNFYGKVYTVIINGVTTSVVTFYGHNGAGTWKSSVWRTVDAGANWTKVDVMDGANQMGEADIIYHNGTWLMLIRRNDTPYGIYQLHSTDNMATWSSPVVTNLASTGIETSNCWIEKNSVGRLNIVVMDRGTTSIKISKNNLFSDIIANPLAYNTGVNIFVASANDSRGILGYPTITRIGDTENYFIGLSSEVSTSRADYYYGIGYINQPN